jgi:ABC-type bacteriocin/lantibiotic exporter with double-glycine peptidase domain
MTEKNPISLNTAEKMIRMEQNVAATFGNYISYDQTDFYKKMSAEEKQNFERFKGTKKTKKIFIVIGLLALLVLFFLLKFGFTGNVINETIGTDNSNILGWVLIGLFVVGLIIFLFKHNQDKKLDTKFVKHSKVMYTLFDKKI